MTNIIPNLLQALTVGQLTGEELPDALRCSMDTMLAIQEEVQWILAEALKRGDKEMIEHFRSVEVNGEKRLAILGIPFEVVTDEEAERLIREAGLAKITPAPAPSVIPAPSLN